MHSVVKLLLIPLIVAVLPADAEVEEVHKDCLKLSEPGHYPDYEALRDYSIERRQYDVSRPRVLLLRVSTSSEAFGGASIVRLGCKLASDFPKETGIQALIFDDKKAARSLALHFTDQTNYGTYLWHLRARFELNRGTRQAFIEYLIPDLQDELLSPKRIRISLSLGGVPDR
jgi:hypothetical protein